MRLTLWSIPLTPKRSNRHFSRPPTAVFIAASIRPKAGRNFRMEVSIHGPLASPPICSNRKRSGWEHRSSGVLVSRDSGKTWRQVDGVPRDVPVNTIAQDPQRPDYVYVGTKQAFFMSHDGGATWRVRGGNLPFGDFTSILINPRNGDEIFAGNAYQIS